MEKVLGVLAGGDIDRDLLRRWAESADRIIAADAGADLLFHISIAPDLVIGDMDSVSSNALDASKERLHISDQDTTDCDKLLAQAEKEGFKSITLIGVEGDLPDHVLAILHSAARSNLDVRMAYRRGIGLIVKPGGPRAIPTQAGRRVSLLAIEPCKGVHLPGAQWEVKGESFSLSEGTSISNRTAMGLISVLIERGVALLFLEVPPEELPIWGSAPVDVI